jgi:hypothetical protein
MDEIRDFFVNWRESELPRGKRVLHAARNLSSRLRGRDCCGHLGEPGC